MRSLAKALVVAWNEHEIKASWSVCTSVIMDAASSLVYQGTLEDESMEEMSRALLTKDEEHVLTLLYNLHNQALFGKVI